MMPEERCVRMNVSQVYFEEWRLACVPHDKYCFIARLLRLGVEGDLRWVQLIS